MIVKHSTVSHGTKLYPDLTHYTRGVPDYPTQPSRHVTEHVEALYRSSLRRSNATNGTIFEVCFLDAMTKFDFQGERVSLPRVEMHKDVQPPKNAEADFWINPAREKGKGAPVMLMLKASLRERYKQEDRDAMIAKQVYAPAPRTIGVVLAETCAFIGAMTPERLSQEREKLLTVKHRCAGIDELIIAYDEDAMLSLFRRIASC